MKWDFFSFFYGLEALSLFSIDNKPVGFPCAGMLAVKYYP